MATSTDTGPNPIHGLWGAVAPAWAEHATFVDLRAAPITTWLLAATAPRPGDRVLELACGAGGLGLAAAPLVVPGGEVVLSDVAPPMVDVAAKRAVEQGVPGVTTRVLDLEQIDEPDASFDVVLCRDGWQFATDPARALQELVRVLVAGGRLGVALWAARDRNPWLGLAFDTAAEQLGRPIPPPGLPGPFSLGDTALVTGLLRDAGLDDVTVEELAVPMRAPSFEAWWSRTRALAGPLAAILSSLPEAESAAMEARAREAAAPYATDQGLELPGVAILASARKP